MTCSWTVNKQIDVNRRRYIYVLIQPVNIFFESLLLHHLNLFHNSAYLFIQINYSKNDKDMAFKCSTQGLYPGWYKALLSVLILPSIRSLSSCIIHLTCCHLSTIIPWNTLSNVLPTPGYMVTTVYHNLLK